jgi:hypothetical protein
MPPKRLSLLSALRKLGVDIENNDPVDANSSETDNEAASATTSENDTEENGAYEDNDSDGEVEVCHQIFNFFRFPYVLLIL